MDTHTLLNQIGIGNLMAVSARHLVKGADCVSFRVGHGRKHAHLMIKLTPADTYEVTYVSLAAKVPVTETETDVHADSIGAVVRRMGDRA